MATLGFIDLFIIVCYLVIVVAIGLSFARKERTSENYFLAGRSLTWPVIGASLFASNIGTEHLVGLAGDAHRVGLVAGGFEWMACLCLVILAVVFVPQYLRTRIYTIPEFLERRSNTNFTNSDYGLIYASFSRRIFAQRGSNGRRQLTHCCPAQEPGRGSLFRVVGFCTCRESAGLSRLPTLDCVVGH
jgi:Na+/pantothenate symporter